MPIERKLTPEMVSRQLSQPDVFSRVEDLRNETNPAAFLERANSLAVELYLRQDTEIYSDFRQPNETDLQVGEVENAVRFHNFGTIKPDNPKFYKLCEAVSAKESLSRNIVRQVLGDYDKPAENKLELTETERIVILGSCHISDVFDDMFVDYMKHLTEDPGEKEVRKKKPDEIKDIFKERGVDPDKFEYLYGLFQEDNGQLHFVPYSVSRALSGHIKRLKPVIEDMNQKLQEVIEKDGANNEVKSYRDYFSTFLAALESRDPESQENLWHVLEEKWVDIKGKVQPIHSMETIFDSLRLRVEPNYILAIRDERDINLQRLHDRTRSALTDWLENRFKGKISTEAWVSSMRKSQSGYYTDMLAGAGLAFRYAGENVPNRKDIRINKGSKIFIFGSVVKDRWKEQKAKLLKILGSENVAKIFDDEENIILMGAGVHIPGHEDDHNAFVQVDTRKKMGIDNDRLVEEWKSDLPIESAMLDFDFLSSKDKIDYLKAIFANAIRTLEYRERKGSRGYYISALLIINTMAKTGMISFSGGNWDLNFDNEGNNKRFFAEIGTVLDEMQDVYETKDGEKAKDLATRYTQETEEVKQLGRSLGMDMDKPLN